jgi:hypothetical protein
MSRATYDTGAQRWEVLTFIGNRWENVWSFDEEPETFASYQDALIAIEEHLWECEGAVRAGHLDDMPTRDSFRIAPCVGALEAT